MKKFETGKPNEYEKFNDWFKKCTSQTPYIIVKNKTKYSSVKWDYINLDPAFEKLFTENSEAHRKQLLSILTKYADNKTRYTMTDLLFEVDHIPGENATKFAADLFDYLTDVLTQTR